MNENLTLRDLASEAANEACLFLKSIDFNFDEVHSKSSHSDLVTEIDQRVESIIFNFLQSRRNNDSFLGEEGTSAIGSSGVRWILDPIDGTTNYVYGIPYFGVSIAAEKNGEVVAGAVADPNRNEIFDAARGFGAQCNGSSICISGGTNLNNSLIATGFSYSSERRGIQAEILSHLLPKVGDIRRFGAAAVDLCWLAKGRVDAFYEEGLNYWDFAAGSLIAEEAGAAIIHLDDFLGEQLIVAATPTIKQDFLMLLEGTRDQMLNDSKISFP